MYITSHTILIYYNNYYYDNYNSYLFFIFIIVLLYVYACVLCCAVLSLLCVCVSSYVSSHMLIHVYLCVFTPPHPPGLCRGEEAGVLI